MSVKKDDKTSHSKAYKPTYSIPNIKPASESSPRVSSSTHKYIDGNGQELREETKHLSLTQTQVVATMPRATDRHLKNYSDYAESYDIWKDRFLEKLGDVDIPTIVGRYYCRPILYAGQEESSGRDSEDSFESTSSDTDGRAATSRRERKSGDASASPLSSRVTITRSPSGAATASTGTGKMARRATENSILKLPPLPSEPTPGPLSISVGKVPEKKSTPLDLSGPPKRIDAPLDMTLTRTSDPGPMLLTSQSFSHSQSTSSSSRGNSPRSRKAATVLLDSLVFEESSKWSNQLLPPEPNPYYYSTYEEYASALRKWAALVTRDVEVVPPSADQLAELVPIDLPEDSSIIEEQFRFVALRPPPGGYSNTSFGGLANVTICSRDPVMEQIKRQIKENAVRELQTRQANAGEATEKVLRLATKQFDIWIKRMEHEAEKQKTTVMHTRYSYDCFGDLHESNPVTAGFLKTTEGQSQFLCRAPGALSASKDKIRGVPSFEISPEPNGAKLHSFETAYLEDVERKHLELQSRYRHHNVFAWYNPKTVTQKMLDEELTQIVIATDQCHHKNLVSLLNSSVHPDLLYNHLAKDWPDAFAEIRGGISLPNISDFVDLLRGTNNELIHAKVALFVGFCLQYDNSLAERFFNLDLERLQYVAYCVQYYTPIVHELRQYSHEILMLARQCFNLKIPSKEGRAEAEKFVQDLFRWYYLREIRTYLGKGQPGNYEKLTLNLTQLIQTSGKQVALFVRTHADFPVDVIVHYIGHSSVAVSSLFFFMLIQLLRAPSPQLGGVSEIVRSVMDANGRFFAALKPLSESKRKHVQLAFQRIGQMLMTIPALAEDFQGFLLQDYMFVDAVCGSNSLWASFIVDIITNDLDKFIATQVSKMQRDKDDAEPENAADEAKECATVQTWFGMQLFLEKKDVFPVQRLLEKLSTMYREHTITESSLLGFKLLSRYAKAIWLDSEIERPKKGKNSQFSVVYPEDVFVLLKSVLTPSTTPLESNAKRLMLATMRHLLKIDTFFDIVKENKDFLGQILALCSHRDPQLMREAWRTFFQLMKYHPGLLARWTEEAKTLKSFMSLISVASGAHSMECGLHYLCKLFELSVRKTKKKETKKQFEDDVKAFCNFFVSQPSYYFSLHIIYKNLCSTYPGNAFHEVARLYYLLLTNPAISKVVKEIPKNSQFSESIAEFAKLYDVVSGVDKTFLLGLGLSISIPGIVKKKTEKKRLWV